MFQFQYFRKILANFSTKKGLLHFNTFYISYVTVANGPILTVILHLNWKNAIIYSHLAVNYTENSFIEEAPVPNLITPLRLVVGTD